MTDSTASMLSVTWTSRTNCGFFRMFTQNLSGRLKEDRQVREAHRSESRQVSQVGVSPISLPDVDGFGVVDAMFLRHVVQEVKEESDSDGRRTLCAEDCHKDVVHKLLQCPLKTDRRETDRQRL